MAGMAEVLAWWVVLMGLWLVFIASVQPLEAMVGAGAALVAACAARAARRAMDWR
jgi:multisubunit Na+/H+ antiporter MnhE subunit